VQRSTTNSDVLPLRTAEAVIELVEENWGYTDVDQAQTWCRSFAQRHAENFPVASLLLPRAMRAPLTAVYAYARIADDIADEGAIPTARRLKLLDLWEQRLAMAERGAPPPHPVFVALTPWIRSQRVPAKPLHDLLAAFRHDARNLGFETETDLIDYCRCSANPVGQVVLAAAGVATPERIEQSDAICTGLQLANFWQDIAVDLPRGRVNVPRETMRFYNCTLDDLAASVANERVRRMTHGLVDAAWRWFRRGRPLLATLPAGRLRWELRAIWSGGARILQKIEQSGYDVLAERPRLSTLDRLRSIIGRPR